MLGRVWAVGCDDDHDHSREILVSVLTTSAGGAMYMLQPAACF